ncbi:coenzyme A transporter [Ceratocystis pirilliformis]|uniref:Mitochondrial thiamine pyrophosphate carrier 1 n=1 Tax=Ceratocystis pirilliformis TaxID=259994 RepID=A0ABR3YJ69_9PEZI
MPSVILNSSLAELPSNTNLTSDPQSSRHTLRSTEIPTSASTPATITAVASRKPQNKHSIDYVWRSGVAGGMAGCAAKTIVAPLDRVKILFQANSPQFAKYAGSWVGVADAMKQIHHVEGPSGLFRGHSATLLRIFPYAAIKFLAYEQIRAIIITSPEKETHLRRLVSGSLAGVTSVFFTYPLELIRVRLAFETKRDGRSTLRTICRQIHSESMAGVGTASSAIFKSGITNFYRGFAPTLIGMLPYAGVSFLTHDTMGDILRSTPLAPYTTLPRPSNAPPENKPPLRSWAELLSGGISGMVSQTSAYPLEVIRRRMQVGGAVGDGHRSSISETVAVILKERGFKGFFVGLTIGYVKVVPMVAVSFYTYERFKMWLGI